MNENNNDLHDVVVGSRIRLARNIAEFPFVETCSQLQCEKIEETVRAGLMHVEPLRQLPQNDSSELDALERQFLMDFQGIGVDHHDASVTINEEDHIRLTVTRCDLDLTGAWDQINQLDDLCEQHLNFAFSPKWGYLTACPANVGTGMRVSVLLHLPAMVKTGQIDKALRSLHRLSIVARNVFGDTGAGDLFRVSNQTTLGQEEVSLIQQVLDVVPTLIKSERNAREFLLCQNREAVTQDVSHAMVALRNCDLNRDYAEFEDPEFDQEALGLISTVRMGIGMGLVSDSDARDIQFRFLRVQLDHQLAFAVAEEDYRMATRLRDQIEQLQSSDRCKEEPE